MRTGIFARTFSRPSLEGVFDAVVGHGIHVTQFNMSVAGLPSLPEEISPAITDRIRRASARRSVIIAAVSGTFNMAHPDPKVRRDGLDRLPVLAGACRGMGTSVVTLCTGTRDREDMWRRHPKNASPEAWRDLLASMEKAVEVAEDHEVVLAFEPEINNVVDSAQKGRRLLDEIRSQHLKVVIDAANLFDPRDPARALSLAKAILGEAFELLGEDIILAHAKDLKVSGEAAGPGKGDLDYGLYLRGLLDAGYDGPLIMHGVREREVEQCLAFLNSELAAAGAA